MTYSNTVHDIKTIILNAQSDISIDDDMDLIKILATIIDSQSHTYDIDSPTEIIQALEDLQLRADDFTLDFDGNEYRLIDEDAIWEIYRDEIQQMVEECYDLKNLDDLPNFIAFSIDWEQTAKNCYADGYGHTFSGYDGSEEEMCGYHIFRTN